MKAPIGIGPSTIFSWKSYQKWAVKEIMKCDCGNQKAYAPTLAVEDFVHKMNLAFRAKG